MTETKSKQLTWVIGVALVLTTVALYWPVRNFEFINVDDPTYVLIVERDEERARWVIRYAYFFHKHRLRADSLMYQLRLFSGVDLPPGLLESLFAAVRQHHR